MSNEDKFYKEEQPGPNDKDFDPATGLSLWKLPKPEKKVAIQRLQQHWNNFETQRRICEAITHECVSLIYLAAGAWLVGMVIFIPTQMSHFNLGWCITAGIGATVTLVGAIKLTIDYLKAKKAISVLSFNIITVKDLIRDIHLDRIKIEDLLKINEKSS